MNAHFYGCLKISYKISNFVSWLAKLYGKEPNNPISFKDLQQQSIHIVINSIKWLIHSYTGWCWYNLKRNLIYAMYIHFEFIIFENKLGNHYGPGLIIQIVHHQIVESQNILICSILIFNFVIQMEKKSLLNSSPTLT
jgi:hypothetical protein